MVLKQLYDNDAECALLASLILGDDGHVVVDEDDFADPRNRLIFRAIGDLRAQGATPDIHLVKHALGSDLQAAGGTEYLLHVTESEIVSYNGPAYARIVRDLADRRRLHEAALEITSAAKNGDEIDPHAVIDAHMSEHTPGAVSVGELVAKRIATLDAPRPHVSITLTPEQPLHYGELVIVAGRPGTGKSAFALQIVHDLAERGVRCRVYSLEMTAEDWIDRLMQQMTPVTSDDFDRGLTPEYQRFVASAMEQVGRWPLEITDRNIGVSAVADDLRRFARRGGKVAVIDYIGVLVSKVGSQSRYDAVTEASRTLKTIAVETGLLVITLAQLNREGIGKDGRIREPVVSDLRESGALEQDADTIVLLHRYEDSDLEIRANLRDSGYILESPDTPICQIAFAKVRRGQRGRAPYYFIGDDMLFERIDRVVRT